MSQAPRIELHPVNQRVQVHVDGKLIVDSTNDLELRETGYPLRHYFPRAVYFSLGDNKDIAWSYEKTIEGMEAIAGRVALGGEVLGG